MIGCDSAARVRPQRERRRDVVGPARTRTPCRSRQPDRRRAEGVRSPRRVGRARAPARPTSGPPAREHNDPEAMTPTRSAKGEKVVMERGATIELTRARPPPRLEPASPAARSSHGAARVERAQGSAGGPTVAPHQLGQRQTRRPHPSVRACCHRLDGGRHRPEGAGLVRETADLQRPRPVDVGARCRGDAPPMRRSARLASPSPTVQTSIDSSRRSWRNSKY